MDVGQRNDNDKSERCRLLIIGAGGHGHVCAEIAEALGCSIAFLDDNNPEAIGKVSDLEKMVSIYDAVFIAIGNNTLREQLFERVESLGGHIISLIHPTAFVSPSATISKGTVIAPKAIVNTHSIIGKGCILSIGAMVDHDVIVEPFVHINAGAICKAGSKIKRHMKIDSGVVIQGF